MLFSRACKTVIRGGRSKHVRSVAGAPSYLPQRATLSSKVYDSPGEAVADIKDGSKLALGGFGVCGIAENLIGALVKNGTKDLTIATVTVKGTKDLTIACVTVGVDGWGPGALISNKQVKRVISSYVGENKEFERQYLQGELEVELYPQGTLAECLRCGGNGIPAFYTPAGNGTWVESGGIPLKMDSNGNALTTSKPREMRVFNGKKYIMEEAIVTEFALVKAWKGDTEGNLVFRGTARNNNPECAKSGKICIAEVEELVPVGEIKPDEVHLPGIFVHRIIKGPKYEKRIERMTVTKPGSKTSSGARLNPNKERIVKRAAEELKDGMYVNLGIGIPTLASNYLKEGVSVVLQSENGLLGCGPYPLEGTADPDLTNASKETVTYIKGSSTFSSSESFGMIRGSKVSLTMLGALQVAQNGDLANWIIPRKMVKGMGGAMDLVAPEGNRVVVTMEHTAKGDAKKILKQCSLPLTGPKVVDRIITELCVFDVDKKKGELVLVELFADVTLEDLKKKTDAEFRISPNLKTIPV